MAGLKTNPPYLKSKIREGAPPSKHLPNHRAEPCRREAQESRVGDIREGMEALAGAYQFYRFVAECRVGGETAEKTEHEKQSQVWADQKPLGEDGHEKSRQQTTEGIDTERPEWKRTGGEPMHCG